MNAEIQSEMFFQLWKDGEVSMFQAIRMLLATKRYAASEIHEALLESMRFRVWTPRF